MHPRPTDPLESKQPRFAAVVDANGPQPRLAAEELSPHTITDHATALKGDVPILEDNTAETVPKSSVPEEHRPPTANRRLLAWQMSKAIRHTMKTGQAEHCRNRYTENGCHAGQNHGSKYPHRDH